MLTVITQIGGLLYIISLLIFRKKGKVKYLYFIGTYMLFTFILLPYIAPTFGRERIKNSNKIEPHSYFYVLTNRNYVTPKMNQAITNIASNLNKESPNIRLVYLDANFPFLDGFPLFPHLSHNDGKKIDISFVYSIDGKLTNKKPSLSGYGVYELPKPNERDQPKKCKENGYWQYDFPKHLTFGTWNKDLKFSDSATKKMIVTMLRHPSTHKVFIEPHLKQRLGIENSKLRYHGCQAVRHDDHIHLQIR